MANEQQERGPVLESNVLTQGQKKAVPQEEKTEAHFRLARLNGVE